MSEDDGFVRITLRIPKDVHQKLTASAAGKKSMNAEIIERLEASLASAGGQQLNLFDLALEIASTERFKEAIKEAVAESLPPRAGEK